MHQASAGKAPQAQVVSVGHKRATFFLALALLIITLSPLPVSYVADTIRSHFPVLGIAGETNIHHLKR